MFEGVLFGLTLYKYYTARAEGWGRAGLVNILARDGMWAFALVFGESSPPLEVEAAHMPERYVSVRAVANLANTLFFTIAPATLAALGLP